jgi:hypothetical protein
MFNCRILAPTLKHGSMKNLFTFCAAALLACTVSAQGTSLDKGSMIAGITFNSAYENDAIADDLAVTLGYAFSDNMAVMMTRDENATSSEDAAINLGVRYFHSSGFYAQANLNDVTGEDIVTDGVTTHESGGMTLGVGSLYMLNLGSFENLYIDPAVVLSRSDEETDMSFTIGIGMKF